jgi:hypothetical protein
VTTEDQMRAYEELMGAAALSRQRSGAIRVQRRKCNCSQRAYGGCEISSQFHRYTCPMYLDVK